jgi:hypothetical protein
MSHYSLEQPDNNQDDGNDEYNPENRARQKAYRETQYPQDEEDNTNHQE